MPIDSIGHGSCLVRYLLTCRPRRAIVFIWGVSVFLSGSPSFAQRSANHLSYGVELAIRSGHADRGFIISDRLVMQPVTWVTSSIAEFSVWGNVPLAETTDGARPGILELEVTHRREWRRLTIGPAVRVYFYRDPLSPYSTRSIEGWLYLSFDAGPFRLFTNHSLDVLTYEGAYFVDAGLESARSISERVEIGGSFAAGWASWRFNDAWVGVAKSTLNRLTASGWLTAYLNSHFYIGPHVELSSIVDPDVRAAALRPTYVLVGLSVGGEF